MTFKMIGVFSRRLCLCLFLFGLLSAPALAAPWFPLGPYGGDARAFAADPGDSKHLFLGTTSGWLYESHDVGAHWHRLSQIDKRDDLVLDHILVEPGNPRRLIVGTWKVDREDGGIYISQDGGKTWYQQAQMRGQSVRAMARSASNPRILVAGTLQGVYRSEDDGVHWNLISPEGSKEIHEIQSLAIDPADPKIIYAGTWHLPWKTTDGGENWSNVKQGIIDDSDVFSIIIDPQTPSTIYLSACSGIYKSVDAADQFKKIQGIPSTARRTRKLLQDSTALDTVYAGTTEGLYKTLDAGKTFARMTDPNVVINDVYVDPANPSHVLLATNRSGVLSSQDGGTTFESSNVGFTARQVSSFASDPHAGYKLYVGVVNDKESGGVFQSVDGGLKWVQQNAGLGGRDVFSLVSTQAGTLLAGTSHGVFRFQEDGWLDSSDLTPGSPAQGSAADLTQGGASPIAAGDAAASSADAQTSVTAKSDSKLVSPKKGKAAAGKKTTSHTAAAHRPAAGMHRPQSKTAAHHTAGSRSSSARHVQAKKPVHPAPRRLSAAATPEPVQRLDAIVYSLVADDDTVFAGTERGLFRSPDDGHLWLPVPSLEMPEVHFFAAHKQTLMAAALKRIAISTDGGDTWTNVPAPDGITQIAAIGVDELNNLWVGAGEGAYYSSDRGATWKTLRSLYIHQVNGIYFDAPEHRVLITSSASTFAFAVYLPDYKVKYWDSGWSLRFVRPVGDHLIGATLFDGMVLQPQMVDSPISSGK
ncbi:MAG TPA: hypothetical protein VGN16_26205 [Acidobacteriaceae bacterium]